MTRVSEMLTSKFLKKEDVGDGFTVTVKSLEELNVALDGAPAELRWCMNFRELSKPMVMNSTNLQTCKKLFDSDESDDWIGRKLILFDDANVSFQGKLTGGIRIRGIPASRLKTSAKARPPTRGPGEDELDDDIAA